MSQKRRIMNEEIKQEDKFIDLVLTCYSFIKDNAKIITIVTAVVIVGVVGYIVYNQNQESTYAMASAHYSEAITTFKDAEKDFLDTSSPTEETENEEDTKQPTFPEAEVKLKEFFQKYPNTVFADKARYQYAKSLYFQEKYPEARNEFQVVVKNHKKENELIAMYAQKAIGNCYEQEEDYSKAISEYEAKSFPTTPNLSPQIRQYVLTGAKFNQALCYEKLNEIEDAKVAYQDVIDEFENTIQSGLEQKSHDLLNHAKEVVTVIEDSLDLTQATKLETDELFFDALVAYTDTIRNYKVSKDISHGLPKEIRQRIRIYEDLATSFINNVQSAKEAEKNGSRTIALNSYNRITNLTDLGLNRNFYERALLNYDRLNLSDKVVSNE
ncbi:tetratricopeptide repeat protein [Candidatus Poribacteria bacterium]|nr:tetratricopeptide repeat protein [Candidatus Poribacteria bacterium]